MEKKPDEAQAAQTEPEPFGQAALLLVESLIHGLIANSALTVAQAIEIVQTAVEVKQDAADNGADKSAALQKSVDLLNSISASLKHDLPQG